MVPSVLPPLAGSQRRPPTTPSGHLWIPRTLKVLASAGLCRTLPVGVDVTARQPCHMPAGPGLLNGY